MPDPGHIINKPTVVVIHHPYSLSYNIKTPYQATSESHAAISINHRLSRQWSNKQNKIVHTTAILRYVLHLRQYHIISYPSTMATGTDRHYTPPRATPAHGIRRWNQTTESDDGIKNQFGPAGCALSDLSLCLAPNLSSPGRSPPSHELDHISLIWG